MTNQSKRILLSIILGVMGILILLFVTGVVSLNFQSNFIIKIQTHCQEILWCIGSTWLGIAVWLWNSRDHSDEGYLKILCHYYVFMSTVISSVVFAISYHLDPSFKIGFYSTSFSSGLVLGFLVASFWRLVEKKGQDCC